VWTNEEAMNTVGLLLRNGVNARLIQTNNGFNLYNLVEIRDFIDDIDVTDGSYTITDEAWTRAISGLKRKHSNSKNLQGTLNLVAEFSETNNKTKYKSDLYQFIRESRLEDFLGDSDPAILVSTIHQTKGREFENMYLAISRTATLDDETRRAVYVAITRAKNNLHILSSNNLFDRIVVEGCTMSRDDNDYEAPSLICIQLSHRDVALGHFKYHRRHIDKLRSGQELILMETGCVFDGKQVIKFSTSFNAQIADLRAKGYIPVKATIRHIVFWQGKEMDNEIKIILPDLEFLKSGPTCDPQGIAPN